MHPSDTAPALVALDARFRIVGPAGERLVPAREFFVLPVEDAAREAWTHALVSAAVVLEMDGDVCRRARIVLGGVAPIPWDRPRRARLLEGQRITPDLAARAADAAVEDARPLTKNRYKVPLTRALVKKTWFALAARG